MIDVDARGRHEAELLREQAARIADTETALQSVLDGDLLVPLVTHGERAPRPVVARDPVSVRRRIPVLVGVAVAAAVVSAIAFLPSNQPKVVPTLDTAVTSSTELVVRPLDPPIECELDLCPSLAVSPGGTLVAYDQAAKTLTWYDTEAHVVPVTADLGVGHVQLEAMGPHDIAYLLADSPDTQSWELVAIAPTGEEVQRTASASPDVDPIAFGLPERFCSGCAPAGDRPAPYPDVAQTSGEVTVRYADRRWKIAFPYTLSTRTQVASRWDGGAVLSLVPESAGVPSQLIELLPDGSHETFDFGNETVHALLPDGSAVVWRDGRLVRLSPPQPPEWPGALAPELTAQTFNPPIACNRSPFATCPELHVSPDGTLVAWDMTAHTLTWYEDEPRVVPLEAELPHGANEDLHLLAIGPQDITYFLSLDLPGFLIAVAPSGTEITRVDWEAPHGPIYPTATGLVGWFGSSAEWPPPDAALVMPWVDLDGNRITDSRPYPTAKNTDAGIEVRLGDRRWLLAGETFDSASGLRILLPRSDGGVMMLLDFDHPGRPTVRGGFDEADSPDKLFELLPDGTNQHYDVGGTLVSRFARLPSTVLPDGSLIVEHNLQLVRLTPRA